LQKLGLSKLTVFKEWMDDNAEQLGTEVLRQMDDEEMKIHGFAIYINDVEEHYEPF